MGVAEREKDDLKIIGSLGGNVLFESCWSLYHETARDGVIPKVNIVSKVIGQCFFNLSGVSTCRFGSNCVWQGKVFDIKQVKAFHRLNAGRL